MPAASACTTCARPISSPSRGDKAVQRHVLALERRYTCSRPAGKCGTAPAHEQALARAGHGPLHHDALRSAHSISLLAVPPEARLFSRRRVRTAVRYQLSSKPHIVAAAAQQRCHAEFCQQALRDDFIRTSEEQIVGPAPGITRSPKRSAAAPIRHGPLPPLSATGPARR